MVPVSPDEPSSAPALSVTIHLLMYGFLTAPEKTRDILVTGETCLQEHALKLLVLIHTRVREG